MIITDSPVQALPEKLLTSNAANTYYQQSTLEAQHLIDNIPWCCKSLGNSLLDADVQAGCSCAVQIQPVWATHATPWKVAGVCNLHRRKGRKGSVVGERQAKAGHRVAAAPTRPDRSPPGS